MKDFEEEARKLMQPATEKERAIVAAAMDLIAKKGVDGATTAEIARRARVTEKTLFRYFPSKKDLVRRVLLPPVLSGGLTRHWDELNELMRTPSADFKAWYTLFTTRRLTSAARNPQFGTTFLLELANNIELRDGVETVWRERVWGPMRDSLRAMQGEGKVRADIDINSLARAIHCINLGYFLIRHALKPDPAWNDEYEIGQMADLLMRGAGVR
ncbi:MAG TPA: helix-turn-helix domain-containing protein [Casimicrobiaceae bacterium]